MIELDGMEGNGSLGLYHPGQPGTATQGPSGYDLVYRFIEKGTYS